MVSHNMSESEEMYLVSVALLEEAGEQTPIRVSKLAKELSIQPVSANQMIRRLEDAGAISYTPYKGVTLTESGRAIALRILRHRRLWEVFLVDKLNLPIRTASELACQMEHIASDEVLALLAIFLEEPTLNPEGKQIPPGNPDLALLSGIHLSQLQVNEKGTVLQLDANDATRSFLMNEGIVPQAVVTVLGIGTGGSLLVEVDRHQVYLAAQVAETIQVGIRSVSS
jgi:DtxR family Mn-dependent transcriptional regulator